MKVIIAGSRSIKNKDLISLAISKSQFKITKLICGMAQGIDSLAFDWAKENNIPIQEMPADWKKYNKAAGPIRNQEMAKIAEALIAIHDGESPGTANMIQEAQKLNLPVYILSLKKEKQKISYSSWQLYRNFCQWRWKLDYFEERKSTDFSIYLDFGSAIHKTCERLLPKTGKPKIKNPKYHFFRLFRYLYHFHHKKYNQKQQEECHFEDFVKSARQIIDDFEKVEIFKKSQILFNELLLEEDINRTDKYQAYFKGYIDLVFRTKDKDNNTILYIADFKSCSWGWNKDQRNDEDKRHQLLLYKYFFCKKFNLDPQFVKTVFILLKRTTSKTNPMSWEFFHIPSQPVRVQNSLNALNSDLTQIFSQIETGNFKKNLDSCTNKWGDRCPYFDKPELCNRENKEK